jgi:hypothetical protein
LQYNFVTELTSMVVTLPDLNEAKPLERLVESDKGSGRDAALRPVPNGYFNLQASLPHGMGFGGSPGYFSNSRGATSLSKAGGSFLWTID